MAVYGYARVSTPRSTNTLSTALVCTFSGEGYAPVIMTMSRALAE
jgi:hypothetical protein